MHIKSAKTIALEQRNFALERFTYQSSQLCPSPRRIRSAWVITASWVRRRAGMGNRSAIVAIPTYMYEAKSREKLTKNFHRIDTWGVRAPPGPVRAAGGSVAGRCKASVEGCDQRRRSQVEGLAFRAKST